MSANIPVPEALTTLTVVSFLSLQPTVLIRVGPGCMPRHFFKQVIQHFSAELGHSVAFGCINTIECDTSTVLMRIEKLFSEAPKQVPRGYYLFQGGQAQAYCPDPGVRPAALAVLGVGFITSWVARSRGPLTLVAEALFTYYSDTVIDHFTQAMAEPPPKPPPEPPPEPAANDPHSPYTLLGIPPTATDEEVKQAFRTQAALTHPDKVAHLAPAIKAFASEQFRLTKAAYEAIMAQRRRVNGW